MNNQILTVSQNNLLPLIRSFSAQFYLVEGTAIALHLGHRRSIDFDLFSDKTFGPLILRRKILQFAKIEHTLSQGEGELTIIINKVKLTFFHYPYQIIRKIHFEDIIKMPDLVTLGAMKAFALGRRAKWKDYVDLYFILQKYGFDQLIRQTENIFSSEFNEKLFRTQLSYFDDIDYSERIDYLKGFEKSDEEIKRFLERICLS